MAATGNPSIQFLGGAKTVTGSKYLVSFGKYKVLVDCGLFQGLKQLRLQNWDRFPVDPKTIDAIVLTHAHIDHSGYIPRIIKKGFSGKIFCTDATRALCEILLPDAGYLQEEEADYMNRKKLSKHHPALPLFSRKEAETSLSYFESKPFDEEFELVPGFRCRFLYAGHILGAASVVMQAGERTIGFSGDVGRLEDPIMYPPAALPPVDYLVVESTYGDRLHPKTNPMLELAEIIKEDAARGGVILVPAFAVGRVQTMMFFLSQLKKRGLIPNIPMYVNSPMANHVTETFLKFSKLHRLSASECAELTNAVQLVHTAEESKELNTRQGPMLIISASGMATGGRILHHLKAFAPDSKNAIVLTGFQAAGTRGEALLNGVEAVKIHGQLVAVRAHVHSLENLSAHADYVEILSWLESAHLNPRQVFVTHGESSAAEAMAVHIQEKFRWRARVPGHLETFLLE